MNHTKSKSRLFVLAASPPHPHHPYQIAIGANKNYSKITNFINMSTAKGKTVV
jgi:hypothetical protein